LEIYKKWIINIYIYIPKAKEELKKIILFSVS
jgi:hypothetical protein